MTDTHFLNMSKINTEIEIAKKSKYIHTYTFYIDIAWFNEP